MRNPLEIQVTTNSSHSILRRLSTICLALVVATTIVVWYEAKPLLAAPQTVSSVRQDRRADRERSIRSTKNSSNTSNSSAGSSTNPSRPRLVRH